LNYTIFVTYPIFTDRTWMFLKELGVTFKSFPESFYSREIQEYNSLNYIFFKIVPLCNNTVLSATVKLLETLLKAIL